MKQRKVYDREFKENAVKLSYERDNIQSISRAINCWGNAATESLFKSLKMELIYGAKLVRAKQMRNRIFEYLEIGYRKQRRHSYLVYHTIEEFNNPYFKKNINNVA